LDQEEWEFSLPAQAFISVEGGRVIQVAAAEAAEIEVDEEEVFTRLELDVLLELEDPEVDDFTT
jgi:hypothetical protein